MSGGEFARLREIAEAATPGPWHHSAVLRGHVYHRGVDMAVGAAREAEFIAAANPATVLALLDRLEAAEAAVERVRSRLDQLAADQRAAMECAGSFETHMVAAINLYSDACDELQSTVDLAPTPQTREGES